MKTVTIRDLRLRWPETERALQEAEELTITRDGRPVARLVRLKPQKRRQTRWDPDKHAAKIRKITGGKMFSGLDDLLYQDRADRSC